MNDIEEAGFAFQVANGCPDLTSMIIMGWFRDQTGIKKYLARSLEGDSMFLNVVNIFGFIPNKWHSFKN